MTLAAPRHADPAQRKARPRPARRHGRSLGSRIVGWFGELLITLGVLGLLFIVWELWWTGIEAETDRQDSLEEFYADMPAQPQAAEADDDEPAPSDFEACYTLEDGTEIGCADHMRSQTGPGDIMGTVYAPRLGDQWAAPIRHGTSSEQIDRGGVGHYTETQWPDEAGNFALAGHRNTNASMLGSQDELQSGDPIYVVSYDGIYIYQVRERHVVDPSQGEVLAPVPSEPGGEAEVGVLTFTTCHPMYSNRERLIHHAEIVDFVPVGGAAPEDLAHHQPVAEMFDAGGAD
jgi:sortase A